MRVRRPLTSFSDPSAVWIRLTPSLALRFAWFRLRMLALKSSEIARPAASSEADWTRRPDDRREMLLDRSAEVLDRLPCATMDDTFVRTLSDMAGFLSWNESSARRRMGVRARPGTVDGRESRARPV